MIWCCAICNDFYVLTVAVVGVGGVTTGSGAVSYKYVPSPPLTPVVSGSLKWQQARFVSPPWWNILTPLLLQNVPSVESDSLLPAGSGAGPVPGGQRVPACRPGGDPPVPLHWHLLLRGPGIRILRWCGQRLPGLKRTNLQSELKYFVVFRFSTSVSPYKITRETS